LAKFGQVYLDDGRWQGRQVIPAAWVREATTSKVVANDTTGEYGYQWWVTKILGDPAYLAFGSGGQMVMVIPSRQMVVVVSSGVDWKDPNALGIAPPSAHFPSDLDDRTRVPAPEVTPGRLGHDARDGATKRIRAAYPDAQPDLRNGDAQAVPNDIGAFNKISPHNPDH
jgi:CubicO group peptidase (beta-lactamase class C family)